MNLQKNKKVSNTIYKQINNTDRRENEEVKRYLINQLSISSFYYDILERRRSLACLQSYLALKCEELVSE